MIDIEKDNKLFNDVLKFVSDKILPDNRLNTTNYKAHNYIIYEDDIYKISFNPNIYGYEDDDMISLYFDAMIKKYDFDCVSNIVNISINEASSIIINLFKTNKINRAKYLDRHRTNYEILYNLNNYDFIKDSNLYIAINNLFN